MGWERRSFHSSFRNWGNSWKEYYWPSPLNERSSIYRSQDSIIFWDDKNKNHEEHEQQMKLQIVDTMKSQNTIAEYKLEQTMLKKAVADIQRDEEAARYELQLKLDDSCSCSCSCSYKGSSLHQKNASHLASVHPGFILMSVVTIWHRKTHAVFASSVTSTQVWSEPDQGGARN